LVDHLRQANHNVRFQVLTAASIIRDDDGGSTHLWNVGRQSFYTAVYPRRQLWTSQSQCLYLLTIVNIESSEEAKDFSSSLCVQSSSEAHPASYPMGTGGPFPGVKRGWRVALTTHPYLLLKFRINKNYNFSHSWRLHGSSGAALLLSFKNRIFTYCYRNKSLWLIRLCLQLVTRHLYDMREMNACVCPLIHLSASSNSRTSGRIWMKFRMDVVPLWSTQKSYFLIYYNLSYRYGGQTSL
jgi:hypothetical protein